MRNKIIRDIEVMSVKDFMQRNYHYPVKYPVFFGILTGLSSVMIHLSNQTENVVNTFLYLYL